LGAEGEDQARRFLARAGLKVMARNYRCPAGEADLIALDRSPQRGCTAPTVVFVEVKTRRDDTYTDPESAVDANKRRHLRAVANYYLASRGGQNFNVRFDVVSVVLRDGEKPRLRHIVDAFQ
jgi:putative endonuclease